VSMSCFLFPGIWSTGAGWDFTWSWSQN